MALNPRLEVWLARFDAPCEVFPHVEVADPREAARRLRAPPCELAIVDVLRDAQGAHLMIALPSTHSFDACVVRDVTHRSGVALESPRAIARLLPDCEPGAAPPIGHLYGLPCFLDPCLLRGESIWFRAGNRRELVRMRIGDFERIARPYEAAACLHRRPA